MGTPTPTIVVLEADQRLAEHIVRELTLHAYTVRAITTIAEAERHCADARPHLVVVDEETLHPDIGAALSRLRQYAPLLLLLQGNTSFDWRLLGADDAIRKPFGWSELAGRVEMILRRAPAAP